MKQRARQTPATLSTYYPASMLPTETDRLLAWLTEVSASIELSPDYCSIRLTFHSVAATGPDFLATALAAEKLYLAGQRQPD